MLGTGLQVTRGRGEDRFYNPARARRAHQNQKAEQLRRAQSDVTPSQSPSLKSNPNREPENRAGSDEPPKSVAVPACEPVVKPLSNLERFLQSITPSVPGQYLSKVFLHNQLVVISLLIIIIIIFNLQLNIVLMVADDDERIEYM